MRMNVEGRRGKPKIILLDTVESDMRVSGECVGDVENRDKPRTRVANHK